MLNSEKKQFLEYARELARNLEKVTPRFVEIQLGWIEHDWEVLPVTIMLNHETSWFGSFESLGWNENVIFNNLKRFEPAPKNYLVLNELIDKAYKNR